MKKALVILSVALAAIILIACNATKEETPKADSLKIDSVKVDTVKVDTIKSVVPTVKK